MHHPPAGDDRPFILLHQMGKVGSTAIAEALKAHPQVDRWQVQNTHTLNTYNHAQKRWFFTRPGRTMPPELETGAYLLDRVLPSGRPLRVISPFREPVARNVSSFFHSLDFYMPGHDRGERIDRDDILAAFYARMRHEVCPKWYFDELLEPFGVDVYATPFAHDRAWQTYCSPRPGMDAQVLVFPHDLPGETKARVIADFLEIDSFEIGRTNEAADRADAALYRSFVAEARIDDAYLDWMYATPFARHFFTTEQLDAFRARWSRTQTDAPSLARAS